MSNIIDTYEEMLRTRHAYNHALAQHTAVCETFAKTHDNGSYLVDGHLVKVSQGRLVHIEPLKTIGD